MADLRRPRGRSSSLRCGRSTSTPTVGPPSSSTGENEAKTNANQRTLTFTGVPNTDKEYSPMSTVSSTETFDYIVVGAGHNGLSAACTLGESGRSVVVVDQLAFLGGLSASRAWV